MKYIWRIIRFTSRLWRYYVAIGVVTVLIALSNLLIPLLTGWAIDEMRRGAASNLSHLVWLAVAIMVVDLLNNLLNNFGGYLGDQMSERLYRLLGARYYQHLLSLPQQFFDRELSGKIINRLNRSIVQISNFMQMMSNNFLQFIFSTIFSLAIVAFYSWPVAALLFSLYPIYIWMTIRTSGKWMGYQEKKNKNLDIATGRFAEAIGQIKVVKSFLQERRELQFFDRHIKKVVAINQPQSKLWHSRDIQRRLFLNVVFFGVFLLIFIQGAKGVFSPGQAVALILYAMQIRIPIFTISFLVENTQRAVADSKDYFEMMNILPAITDQQGALPLRIQQGVIEFRKVSFAYDNEKKVLNDISFKVHPSTKIALVGESGEGKTTITNLLLRLYEPEAGKILIDDQDIQAVTQTSLRESIGIVFQDPALFSGSIKENIAYANPNATEEEVIAAAKAANAHEFISKFERSYHTEIGERGLKLSGGQKQRIAIARALLKDAPILVLDEATSSLDSRSEAAVQDALERLMKGRTTLIIAHRLSTIQNVDMVVTLRGGRVAEVGTPAELEASGGIYAKLLKLQRGRSEETKKQLKAYELAA